MWHFLISNPWLHTFCSFLYAASWWKFLSWDGWELCQVRPGPACKEEHPTTQRQCIRPCLGPCPTHPCSPAPCPPAGHPHSSFPVPYPLVVIPAPHLPLHAFSLPPLAWVLPWPHQKTMLQDQEKQELQLGQILGSLLWKKKINKIKDVPTVTSLRTKTQPNSHTFFSIAAESIFPNTVVRLNTRSWHHFKKTLHLFCKALGFLVCFSFVNIRQTKQFSHSCF